MNKITKIKKRCLSRVSQGDIFSDIEMVEYAIQKGTRFEISKINFPKVVVLSQDCDLEQDYKNRWGRKKRNNQDKYLFSVIVAPLYNAEHFFEGKHLERLDLEMQKIDSESQKDRIKKNDNPRFHYLNFPESVPLMPSIIDFKHYFTVNIEYLKTIKPTNFICKISELYREDVSQRFANFLSRIGLP